jgi:hypothetical protein
LERHQIGRNLFSNCSKQGPSPDYILKDHLGGLWSLFAKKKPDRKFLWNNPFVALIWHFSKELFLNTQLLAKNRGNTVLQICFSIIFHRILFHVFQ